MNTIEYAALLATAIGGVLAYSYQQVAATLADRRENQLKRVEEQLSIVYGPLLAITNCNMQIFELFAKSSTPYEYPEQMIEIMHIVHSDEKVRSDYILWMRTALLPNHRAACAIIETKTHLFEHDNMADFLIQYVAMVRAYDILEAKWQKDDFSQLFSPLRYPIELNKHVIDTFCQLRERQHQLLTQAVDPFHYFILEAFSRKNKAPQDHTIQNTYVRTARDSASSLKKISQPYKVEPKQSPTSASAHDEVQISATLSSATTHESLDTDKITTANAPLNFDCIVEEKQMAQSASSFES